MTTFGASQSRLSEGRGSTSVTSIPARQPPLVQCVDERIFIDDAATGDDDQIRVWLHASQRICIDEVIGLRRERRGDDDDVGLLQQVWQPLHVPRLDDERRPRLGMEVDRQDLHVEAARRCATPRPIAP